VYDFIAIDSDIGCKTKESKANTAVRVPGYREEMYYVSCEVRTEFIYVM
jgi:hypothetical protein